MNRYTAQNTFAQRSHYFVVVLYFSAYKAAECTAVFFVDNYVVGHVDQTAGKITGVGGLKRGIRKTFSGTVGRDEVFQHRQTLLEVRKNRVLDNLAAFGAGLLGLCHKTTHTGQLTNLVFRTTGTRVEHHVYSVEALVGIGHLLHKDVGKAAVDVCPDIDNLVVAFGVGDETHRIVVHHFLYVLVTFSHNFLFFGGDNHVAEVERQTAAECHVVTEVFDVVEELCRAGNTAFFDYSGDDVTQRFL